MIRKAVHSFLNTVRASWHLLVWDDVRAGTIKLNGMPRSFRVLMRLGFWLSVFLLVSLVLNDAWRSVSRLQPLAFYNDELAGIYVPDLFVPVTFGLLAIAWAFLLTGALHIPWPVKLLVLILFGMFNYGLMITPASLMLGEVELLLNGFSLRQAGGWNIGAAVAQFAGWMLLLGFFIVRWRRSPRPGLEFPLMLVLTTGLLFAPYFAIQLSDNTGQSMSLSGLQLSLALGQMDTVLVPFLVLAGVEVVQLGMTLTGVVAARSAETFHRANSWAIRLWAGLLGALLLFRLGQQWLWPLVIGGEIKFSWGAVIIWALFILIFVATRPLRLTGSLPNWTIPGVAFSLYAALFVIEIGSLLSATVGVVFILGGAVTFGDLVLDWIHRVFDLLVNWNEVLISLVAMAVSVGVWVRARMKRQPLPGSALYLLLFGVWVLWWIATRPSRVFAPITFRYEHFDTVATLLLSLFFAGLLILRRLTPRALLLLSAAVVLFWVLEARDLLDDPLSPLFLWLGAQAAFLSVSVFLNIMSAGNRFALNADSPRWPRMARGLLYLGYALLTVISVNWLVVGHQASGLAAKDLLVHNGFSAVGLPFAIWGLMTGSEIVLGTKKDLI